MVTDAGFAPQALCECAEERGAVEVAVSLRQRRQSAPAGSLVLFLRSPRSVLTLCRRRSRSGAQRRAEDILDRGLLPQRCCVLTPLVSSSGTGQPVRLMRPIPPRVAGSAELQLGASRSGVERCCERRLHHPRAGGETRAPSARGGRGPESVQATQEPRLAPTQEAR